MKNIQFKNYADTDFFLALMKESDWLKEKAIVIYNKYKGNIWITPFTVAEIMIICKRKNISLRETLIQLSRIAKLEGMEWKVFLKACKFIEEGATIFDSLLMSFSHDKGTIISSDKIYKKFGVNTIEL